MLWVQSTRVFFYFQSHPEVLSVAGIRKTYATGYSMEKEFILQAQGNLRRALVLWGPGTREWRALWSQAASFSGTLDCPLSLLLCVLTRRMSFPFLPYPWPPQTSQVYIFVVPSSSWDQHLFDPSSKFSGETLCLTQLGANDQIWFN